MPRGWQPLWSQHLELLARVSEALEDEQVLEKLKTTTDSEDIYKVLNA